MSFVCLADFTTQTSFPVTRMPSNGVLAAQSLNELVIAILFDKEIDQFYRLITKPPVWTRLKSKHIPTLTPSTRIDGNQAYKRAVHHFNSKRVPLKNYHKQTNKNGFLTATLHPHPIAEPRQHIKPTHNNNTKPLSLRSKPNQQQQQQQ